MNELIFVVSYIAVGMSVTVVVFFLKRAELSEQNDKSILRFVFVANVIVWPLCVLGWTVFVLVWAFLAVRRSIN